MRLIDADAMLERIVKLTCVPCRENGNDYKGVRCRACQYGDEIDDIESAPTIEPQRQSGREVYQAGYADGYKAGQEEQALQSNLQPTCNQLATDCISRQAAIDALCNDYCGGHQDCKYYPKCENLRSVQGLPSAQPEIIRCGECAHKDKKIDYCHYLGITICECDYCSYAVRRTNG